jgi:hypothetical protein
MIDVVVPVVTLLFAALRALTWVNTSKIAHINVIAKLEGHVSCALSPLHDPRLGAVHDSVLEINNVE